jgi:hypothetical protein
LNTKFYSLTQNKKLFESHLTVFFQKEKPTTILAAKKIVVVDTIKPHFEESVVSID